MIRRGARSGTSGARRGTLSVKGSDTMVILAQRWAEGYMRAHDDVSIQVSGGGSGTGIAALLNGTTEIATASRPMRDREREELRASHGVTVHETAVALDALAVYVDTDNPIASLTISQLAGIYRGQITHWSEVGGPDRPIVLYSRENNSGTYAYFKEHVLDDYDFAATTQTLPGTAAVMSAVSRDPGGIGYGGIGYATGVRAIPIAVDGGEPVEPTLENATSGAYPLFEPAALEEIGGLAALIVPQQWRGYDEDVYIWQPVGGTPKLNIVPLFVGTLKVTGLAMILAVPLAVGAAIYVSQYASARMREILKPAIELLASIPSVVLGFLALIVLASAVQDLFGFHYRLNATVAAIGLSLAVVPLVFTISEDALSAVPRALTDAALALGARKHQVVLRVVLPAALPGIAAAVLLGLGRAIGETMVVLMASGNASVIELFDPTSSARTVTATIASELGEVSPGDPHWRVLFLLGSLLFVLTLGLNRAGAIAVERMHRRLTGER